jgi:peptidyl-prolyl cis-trans isomerase SurA
MKNQYHYQDLKLTIKKGKYLFYSKKHQKLTKYFFVLGLLCFLVNGSYAQTKDKTKVKPFVISPPVSPSISPSNVAPIIPIKEIDNKPKTSEIDKVIAIVNREVITEQELKKRIDIINQQFIETKKPLPPKDTIVREVLERLIDESVMFQEASTSGVRVLEQEMDGILANIANQKNITVNQLKIDIEKSGTKWDKYLQSIRRDVVISRFRERAVESKIKITDLEIEAFINNQLKRMQSTQTVSSAEPDLIAIAQILVPIPTGASNSEIAALKVKAQNIYDQAAKEAEFLKYANQLAVADKLIRAQDLGYRTLDRLPQVFIEATNGIQAGGLAPQVIQTPAGFHVLKLLDRRVNAATQASNTSKSDSIYINQSEVNQILLQMKQGVTEQELIRRLNNFRGQILAKTANIGDLAVKFSEDPNATRNKGYLGWISPGQVPPEIDIALSRLSPGEVSEPFQTEYGWHIMQLINRRQAEVTGAQQKEYARASLRQMKLIQANEDWMRELRDNATIELRPPYTMTN